MRRYEEEIAQKVREEIEDRIPKEKIHDITFKHERLQAFYDKYVKHKKSIKPEAHDVIVEIMKLLDEKGDCPSVVQNPAKGDFDATRLNTKKNEYDLLSQVKLLDHSLNVAEELLKAHNFSLVTMARDIIAALGHDLGKIPEYHTKPYATGDHPTISLLILSQIQGFKDLPCVEEVKDAVKKHHLSPSKAFSKDLKSADQRAREKELDALLEEKLRESESEQEKLENGMESEQNKPNTPAQSQGGSVPDLGYIEQAKREKAAGDDEEKKRRIDDSGIDLEWFSPEKMLMAIKERYLNKMIGKGFDAFSTKNGYVFVQAGKIMDIFREMAEEEGRLQDYDITSKEQRKAIQLKIVNIMRESGYIAEELVHKGYFGGWFIVKFKPGTLPDKGDMLKGFYTPFYSTAFSSDIASLEAMKEGILRNIESVEIAK